VGAEALARGSTLRRPVCAHWTGRDACRWLANQRLAGYRVIGIELPTKRSLPAAGSAPPEANLACLAAACQHAGVTLGTFYARILGWLANDEPRPVPWLPDRSPRTRRGAEHNRHGGATARPVLPGRAARELPRPPLPVPALPAPEPIVDGRLIRITTAMAVATVAAVAAVIVAPTWHTG
jgi:hypothetical protein